MLSLLVMNSKSLWDSLLNNKGFNLIELIVVLFIISILGIILFNVIGTYIIGQFY